ESPGAVLELATGLGEIVRVKVDNLRQQQLEFAAAVAQRRPVAEQALRETGTSVVAVALGAGFQRVFESYGATVVRVERTMNPSVGQIADAISQATRSDVIVLPNDPNAALAA